MRLLALLVALAVPVSADAIRAGKLTDSEVRVARREGGTTLVPGGTFTMGVDEKEREAFWGACRDELDVLGTLVTQVCDESQRVFNISLADARRVYVSAFEIDVGEVTTRRYRECVSAKVCDPRPLIVGDTRYVRDPWPMVNVTWDEAQTYCEWRGMRLPTEAEWEKAARGLDGRRWPWGNWWRQGGANLGGVASAVELPPGPAELEWTIDASDGTEILAPPGAHRWGKSPYRLYDMSGNVSEWVADWYYEQGYEGLPLFDPVRSSQEVRRWRVVRGGSSQRPRFFARTYVRDMAGEGSRAIDRGFRCARSVGSRGEIDARRIMR